MTRGALEHQEGISLRLRKAAFGSTIRMHMGFFDTPEMLGFEATNDLGRCGETRWALISSPIGKQGGSFFLIDPWYTVYEQRDSGPVEPHWNCGIYSCLHIFLKVWNPFFVGLYPEWCSKTLAFQDAFWRVQESNRQPLGLPGASHDSRLANLWCEPGQHTGSSAWEQISGD